MDQTNEQEKIICVMKEMVKIIESKPYNKRQLIDLKKYIKKLHDTQNKDLLHTCYNNLQIDFIYLICKNKKKKLLRYLLHESHILHYFASENKYIEIKYREDTLFYALCLNEFKIIELLYDHWTGDLHWSGHKKEYNDFDVHKFNQINNLLKVALERYEDWSLSQVSKKIDQTVLCNIQSLIALNDFQRDLYTKLNELKKSLITLDGNSVDNRLSETEAIRDMILAMFNCYEEHTKKLGSIMQKSVYENPSEFSELSEFFETPKDTSELQRKTYLYVFFEVYFRKLDYNICLLILDNLHSLKLRLKMPEDSYQKLENKVYQFIYHLSNNWNLYLPKNKNMKTKEFLGQYNNINCIFSLKYNEDTFQRGLNIMYLEKRDFENALNDFKEELKNTNIKENIRSDKTQLSNQETNSLTLLPELRDIYSLKRISQHIAQLFSVNIKYTKKYVTLLVERILQVVGEFLKSTNATQHLQPTTEALIEVEISVDIINDLKSLRDLLCHVKDGELLKRIVIEANGSDIFDVIFMELKSIKKKIDEVIMICKPLVEKSLILYALSLIEKRRKAMPEEVANYWFTAIKRVRLLPQSQPYMELFEAPVGFAEEYATEAIMLVEHSLQLDSKLLLVTENIRNNLIRKFSIYKEIINSSLQKISNVKMTWQQIVNSLKYEIPLSDFPNEKDANIIKSYSKKADLSDDLNRLIQDINFAYAEIHFKFIKKILGFIILKTETIHCPQDELDNITRELETLNCNDKDMERVVTGYLLMIEKKINTILNMKHRDQCLEFKGIKELRRKLTVANFLNQKEKKYLTDTLRNNINKSTIKPKTEKIEEMISKINNDEAIPKNEYTNFITTIKLDEKAQKILMNLVMGYKRDPLHPLCLSNRISILREITKDQSVDHLVTRYKLDKTFRALLEILVFDIFAILDCTKNNKIVKKSSKLLTEINLRNYLIHGSPLLEKVGNVLDSNDWPTELVTKIIELLKEERSINAQCALIDFDFDFTQINSSSLSPEKCALVTEFKTSARWKDYLTFIPDLKQTNRKKQQEIAEVDKNLLDAVKDKDSDLVLKRIVEGGNVNFVDNCKRALIHHAAIKGSVDVIKVLVDNGADVNILCKYNMTALHYSAMNGYVAAVELLLKNGANYLALDDQGRTPLYLANQRNHHKVCRMLVQAMKK